MKYFILAIIFFTTATTIAQDKGVIKGNLLDSDSKNTPIAYATVSIKETGEKVATDTYGNFSFKNLKKGTYTLLCRFVGYEEREYTANVAPGEATPVTLTLSPSTVSLDELMMTLASANATSDESITQ